MIEPDGGTVEAVLGGQPALDFVRLDRRVEYLEHGQLWTAAGAPASPHVVGYRQDRSEVVGRMAAGECGVAVVKPADHRADVERRLERVQQAGSARYPHAIARRRDCSEW